MLDLKPAPRRVAVGDNGGPTFDDVVRENIEVGIWLSCVKSMSAAMQDMRVTRLQLRVFGHLIDFLNAQTGMAYPGRKLLAERSGYSEAAVARSISELIGLGYIVSVRRQPTPGARAMAHYALARPTVEEIRTEIGKYVAQKKATRQPGWKPEWEADEPTVVSVSKADEPTVGNEYNGGNVTPVLSDSPADEPTVGNVTPVLYEYNGVSVSPPDVPNGGFVTKADEYNGGQTVTSKILRLDSNNQSNPREASAIPKDLAKQLFDAGGPGLANPAGAAGLLHLGLPVSWIESGADLERDVLETIRAVCAVHHAKGRRPISQWAYFEKAVADAKARRERGLPPPNLAGARPNEDTSERWKRLRATKSMGAKP